MISILVPWRSADPARTRLWDFIRPLWESEDVELVTSDDGYKEGRFARSRAYNRASRKSTGDVLVTYGANHLPNMEAIRLAVGLAEANGWSRVFTRAACYTAEETDRVLAGETVNAATHDADVAGILAIRRDAWEAVGGFDERFGRGYGYEDVAMRVVLAQKYGFFGGMDGALHMLDHGNGGANRITPANEELFVREYLSRFQSVAS